MRLGLFGTMVVMKMVTALVIGASGLVGCSLVDALLKEGRYFRVILLVRHSLAIPHEKIEEHCIDFAQLDKVFQDLGPIEDVYCCLGTTMRKAGSKSRFREIDYEIPYKVAQCALTKGAKQFLLVSSQGAHPQSLSFYCRVKGELEVALRSLGYKGLLILRPSLLLGERQAFRFFETMAQWIVLAMMFIWPWALGKYAAIPAIKVAQCMVKRDRKGVSGVVVLESDKVAIEGKSLRS